MDAVVDQKPETHAIRQNHAYSTYSLKQTARELEENKVELQHLLLSDHTLATCQDYFGRLDRHSCIRTNPIQPSPAT